MAGWLVVWTPDGEVDAERWQRSIELAGRFGETVVDAQTGRVRLAAWRRAHGEFPLSGQLHRRPAEITVAWVGQCWEDEGDSTATAIDTLAEAPSDASGLSALNGHFAAALVDPAADRVCICTDRHRHYPVYLWRGAGLAVASTDMTCLLPWVSRPKINRAAAALLLFTGELIDRLTLVEDVDLLPPATMLSDERGEFRERRYWRFAFAPDVGRQPNEWAADIAQALQTAVTRVERTGATLGVPLSGGLDSRLLLGLCQSPARVPSFTWGFPQCRDRRYAAAFARAIGSPHRAYDWRLEAFPPVWVEGIDRTAGMFGIQDMFVLPYARVLAEHCESVLNGLAGDVLLGGNFLKQSWMQETDPARLALAAWHWRVAPDQEAWGQRLLAGETILDEARRSWSQSLERVEGGRPVECLQEWLFENRIFRFTNSGTLLLRSAVESYSPFFDREVIELIRAVPCEFKWKHRLYLDVLRRACPAAARVPWQRTAIPPSWGFRATLSAMAAHKLIRTLCKPLGVSPFAGQSVADVPGWLRGVWAPLVQGMLLDERTLDRGVLEPDALRALWQAHLDGQDCTRQLGVALAIEVFGRVALDGCGVEQVAQPLLAR